MMVSMTIFTVLMVAGMGALLSALQQNKASQNMQTAMNNINFIMEDMSRNIRLGSNFHCQTGGETDFLPSSSTVYPWNCYETSAGGSGNSYKLTFNDTNNTPISYVFSYTGDPDHPNAYQIYKDKYTTDGTNVIASSNELTPSSVVIDLSRSGFTVRGAQNGDGQPLVTIRISGSVSYHGIKSTFSVENSVSPRALDPNN